VLKLLFQLIVDYFYFPVRAGFVTNLVRSFVRLMIWAMGLTWVFPLAKLHLSVSKSLLTQVFFWLRMVADNWHNWISALRAEI